jgi:hypothetical protein
MPTWLTSSDATQSRTWTPPTGPPNPDATLEAKPTQPTRSAPAPTSSSGSRRVLRARSSMRAPTLAAAATNTTPQRAERICRGLDLLGADRQPDREG